MSPLRFLSIDLSFGRHDGRFEFDPGRPAVVAGPNGSGKSTLVDGLLRTVFGFNRRVADDRSLADARRPWDGRPFRSTIRLAGVDDDVLTWTRDHETDEVRVDGPDGTLFSGSANPTSRGSADRPYWEIVERLFGVTELDAYARTAYVGQGRLLGTGFDAEILRLAAGGHRRWQEACRRLEERHRELTRAPISDAHRRLGRDRRMETAIAELERVEGALRDARAAREAAAATGDRLEEVEREIADLERRLADLAARRSYLLERAKVEAERADARQRFDRLVDLRTDLEDTRREAAEAERERAAAGADRDPPDFPARAAALREAWDARDRCRHATERLTPAASTPTLAAATAARAFLGAGLVTGGLASWIAGIGWGWVAALVGAAIGVHAWAEWRAGRAKRAEESVARADAEARLAVAERAATTLEAELGGDLDRATLPARLEAFERRRAAETRLEAAKQRQTEVMRRIDRSIDAEDRPGRTLPRLIADAERRLNAVEADARRLAAEAPADLVERGLSERAVDDAAQAARADLAARRAERDRLLLERDRAQRSGADASRLELRSRELAREVEDLRRSVESLRAARRLLQDGYDEYREQDESRLVAAVSRRLEQLGAPPLGPFETNAGLDGPTVSLDGRRLPMDSPHLSHGQRHLVMLAVRLGAADFLAADGPEVPLIVDEPFAHLDDLHATQVWNLLREISVERQVIVTTQEVALLDRLGAEADARLERPVSNPEPANRLRGETTNATDRSATREGS